ncbi:hypothetical protein BT93_E2257 [Corymbia citriodora subsp. variegata]|nr:hypothetical protein BT93_E2257 [Corymbia citriodora subsp. variegata]
MDDNVSLRPAKEGSPVRRRVLPFQLQVPTNRRRIRRPWSRRTPEAGGCIDASIGGGWGRSLLGKMNFIKLLNRLRTLKIYFMSSGHHCQSCISSGLMPLTYVMRSLICCQTLLVTREEFLSFSGGDSTHPAVHQFLLNSVGEVGMKRVPKVVCGAGKELQLVVLNHLQVQVIIFSFGLSP